MPKLPILVETVFPNTIFYRVHGVLCWCLFSKNDLASEPQIFVDINFVYEVFRRKIKQF